MKSEKKRSEAIPGFHAVQQSRKAKEAVGAQIAHLDAEQTLEWFKKRSVIPKSKVSQGYASIAGLHSR